MSTEIAAFKGGQLPTNPADLATGLQTVGMNLQSSGSAMPILRLMKSGLFVYGQENIEVEEGSEWAVNPYSIEHGWACWNSDPNVSELLGEVLVPFNVRPPAEDDLPDYGDTWQQCVSVVLQCVAGQDKGTNVQYKGTSLGLRNWMKELTLAVSSQAQADPEHVVPVVSLESDYYQHKKHGQTFFPVLDVLRWISMGGVEASEAGASPAAQDDQSDADSSPSADAVAETSDVQPDASAAQPAGGTRRRRRRQK